MTLEQVADELGRRLIRIFMRDEQGRRAVFGDHPKLQNDPHFRDYLLFYEYFHGDTGARGRGVAPDRLDRPGRQAAAAATAGIRRPAAPPALRRPGGHLRP